MRLAHIRHKTVFHEPVWHVLLAIAVVIGLQIVLNDKLILFFGFKYVIVALEALLVLILSVFLLPVTVRRILAILLIALISVANIISLGMVIDLLFTSAHIDGRQLLISSVAIYITNIIVFGLWYWELDNTRADIADFQFPQNANQDTSRQLWQPTFFDYLYVSVTNATAFSPTDTMPLTHRAKLLMTVQSLASLIAIALVAARAVNILS
jgi:hypothetical protein